MSRTNLSFRDDFHRLLDAYAIGNSMSSTIVARGVVLASGLQRFVELEAAGQLEPFDSAIEVCREVYPLFHQDGSEKSGGVDLSSISPDAVGNFQVRYSLPKKSTAYRILMIVGISGYDYSSISTASIDKHVIDALERVRKALAVEV